MSKKYLTSSFVYAIIAMALGVFYRELTKFSAFDGITRLSVMHTHYFMLGVFFFIILALLEKSFPFSQTKNAGKMVGAYHIGLNITGLCLFARGLTQVLMPKLSNGLSAALSGISGIGHIILGVSMAMLLWRVRKSATEIK